MVSVAEPAPPLPSEAVYDTVTVWPWLIVVEYGMGVGLVTVMASPSASEQFVRKVDADTVMACGVLTGGLNTILKLPQTGAWLLPVAVVAAVRLSAAS